MAEHKPLYVRSLAEAIRNDERGLWQASYRENCDCARAIERAIADAYDYETSTLGDCAHPILEQYGFNRVHWVLANTILEKSGDGRFSIGNRDWARQFHVPVEDTNQHFCVEAHPGLTDIFLNQVRRAGQELGPLDDFPADGEGMTMGGM